MTTRFLTSSGANANLSDGSATIYALSLGASSLDPSMAVKTNAVKQLISSNLDIADVNGLQQALDNAEIKNPLEEDLSIGGFDITGLPFGQTLIGLNSVVINQNTAINDSAEKVQNITSSVVGVSTTFQGTVSAESGLRTEFLTDVLNTSTIQLNVNAINLTSTALNFNGDSVLTSASSTISDIEQKIQNISGASAGTTNLTGDLYLNRVYDPLGASDIQMTNNAVNITATNLKFNTKPILYNEYPSQIETGGFKKTGGTNTQYLLADGSTIQQSAVSGNSNFYLYISNNTITPPPNSGQVRYNNAVQQNATIVYISHLTSDNTDVEIFFTNVSVLNDLYIQDRENSLNYIKYNITGSPTIIPNNYISVPVSVIDSAGTGTTSFGTNHPALLSFFVNNLEIDTRLSALEDKTVNQTAVSGTTTFSGSGGIVSDKFVKTGGLTTQFLKANGDSDATSYASTTITNALAAQTANIASVTVGVDTNFTGTLTSSGFKTVGGLSTTFLKANGSTDINSYNNIQYLMTTAPATISNSAVETVIIGTGLTSNNMGMTFTDALNYSRNIYIAGTIRYLANAVLTIRFRIVSGTTKITFPITLPNQPQSTLIPFIITMNYTIFTPNLYQSSCNLNIAGAIATSTFMANASQACSLGSFNRTVSAQWSAASASNQLTVTELMVKNNYIG